MPEFFRKKKENEGCVYVSFLMIFYSTIDELDTAIQVTDLVTETEITLVEDVLTDIVNEGNNRKYVMIYFCLYWKKINAILAVVAIRIYLYFSFVS